MALLLQAEVGSIKHIEKLDLAELEALQLEAASNEALRTALRVLFDTGEFSESKRVGYSEFVKAIDTVLREGKATLGATVYSIYDSPMPGVIPKGTASGGSATIGGRRCLIMGGVNQCTLTRCDQDERGEWKSASVEDVRHLSAIKTDDQGEIEIRRRNKPSTTCRLLRRIKKALSTCSPDSDVQITVG
jgi:hypothetical protein